MSIAKERAIGYDLYQKAIEQETYSERLISQDFGKLRQYRNISDETRNLAAELVAIRLLKFWEQEGQITFDPKRIPPLFGGKS